MPSVPTVLGRVARDQVSRGEYVAAMEARATAWAAEIEELAEASTPEDWQVRRLQIDTKKWLAARFFPSQFGDRLAHQQLDAAGNPTDPARINVLQVAIERLDGDDLADLVRLLEKIGVTLDGREQRQIKAKAESVEESDE